jgi:hypothetical protein
VVFLSKVTASTGEIHGEHGGSFAMISAVLAVPAVTLPPLHIEIAGITRKKENYAQVE